MKLLLTKTILVRLHNELKAARNIEIGGLVLGEHVGGDVFRAVELTVQRSGGSPVHFVREPSQHKAQLDDFFSRTGADYTRFNYMGEWHSHPTFEPHPSVQDIFTMRSIVEDAAVGVNFLVLLIARLTFLRQLRINGMLFQPNRPPSEIIMEMDGATPAEPHSIASWIKNTLFKK